MARFGRFPLGPLHSEMQEQWKGIGMDRLTAIKVLRNCSSVFEPLNDILLDRSSELAEEDFSKLRHGVADILAYIFDLLIEPAIAEYPDLNPYDKDLG